MKSSIHRIVGAAALLLLGLASMAGAADVELQTDADTGEKYVNMPTTDTNVVSITAEDIANGITSFKVYDDGGKNGNFSRWAKGYLQLKVPEGYVLQASGTLITFGQDFLTIYDGTVDSPELITGVKTHRTGSYNGYNYGNDAYDIDILTSSSNMITLLFVSMGGGDNDGLDLTVTIVDATTESSVSLNEVIGGSVTSSVASATAGSTVALTAEPKGDSLLLDVEVKDANGNPVFVYWEGAFDNTITFNMPNSDVSVTPVFTDNLSAEGGLFVNIPATGSRNVTIPAGMTSIKVYDCGGEGGGYGRLADGSLTLTPPEGHMLQVVGTMYVSNGYDNLYLYDENTLGKTIKGNTGDIGFFAASDAMKFHLKAFSDKRNTGTPDGLDLTVMVVSASDVWTIGVNSVVGGSVTPSVSEAVYNTPVTLTITPDLGYMLKSISVTDADYRAVPVAWNGPFENSASFTMPFANMTVKPVFTNTLTAANGIYVNMPATGTKTINLPEQMSSLKVYGDGGKSKNYSMNADGYLELIAPKGYFMRVTGKIETEANNDVLTIYDGGSDGTVLFEGSSPSNGADRDIGIVETSDNKLTIHMSSDKWTSYYGPELTVTLDLLPPRVKINSVVEGGVVADEYYAQDGDTVTLTATPASGYVLSGVTVVDDDGTPVEVVGGKWYSGNQAKFAMPEKPVTVTPVFTDDLEHLSVNMTITTDITSPAVVIPEGVTSFKVYDDGGKDGNYTDGVVSALSVGAPEGTTLQMAGTMVMGGDDYLAVVDGFRAMNILVYSKCDVAGEPVSISVTSDSLVILSQTYAPSTYAGFDLTVMVVNPNVPHKVTPVVVAGGVVATDKMTALPGEAVTLTVEPGDGYLLVGFEIEDAVGNSYVARGGDFASNTGSFEMPAVDVTVKPLFTNDKSGLFVTMPASGQKTVAIPEGVTSFKVYDDGGKDGYTGSTGIGELVLTPAEGTAFQISGVAYLNAEWTRGVDSMAIARISDGKAMWVSNSGVRGQVFNVSELFVAGGVRFYMDAYDGRRIPLQGIDFTVEVVDATTKHNVNVADVTGGSMDSDKDEAAAGETVTLAATPNNGFILSSVRVDGENGEPVSVDGGTWYSNNAASFDMPANGVTVTPEFTNDWSAEGGLYIQMPKYGITNVDIPEGVTSFKIYDDGGKDGGYYEYTQNELLLTAPEGYVMRLTGTMVADGYAYLRITDGTIFDDYGLIATGGKISPLDVGTLFTSGNTMFISFKARSSDSYEGLDLKVEVVKASVVSFATVGGKDAAVINGNFNGTEAVDVKTETYVDTVIFQRSFTMNTFSTIVLPFDINAAKLVGVKSVITFTGMTENAGGLPAVGMGYVWCSEEVQEELRQAAEAAGSDKYDHCYDDPTKFPGTMTAYTPYMVQMKSTRLSVKSSDKIKIKPSANAVSETRVDDWVFRGALQKHVWTAAETENGTLYGFAAKVQDAAEYIGHFVRLGAKASAQPLRAYMEFAPEPPALPARRYVYNAYATHPSTADIPKTLDVVIVSSIGNDANEENGGEHTTVIGRIDTRTGEIQLNGAGTRTFDLMGRSVGKPASKGMYLKK